MFPMIPFMRSRMIIKYFYKANLLSKLIYGDIKELCESHPI